MISVMVQTCGASFAPRFLAEFRQLADALNAEYIINAEGDAGEKLAREYADKIVRTDTKFPEQGIGVTAHAASGDYILRFDDDETVSEAMRDWLLTREWEHSTERVFSFPYAWLWGDENHFITSAPHWVDPHARLMPKDFTERWAIHPHAGNIFGLGKVVPVAHLHHKFLVKSYAERLQVAARYDALADGAGSGTHYGNFTIPERVRESVLLRKVGRGDVKLDEWTNTGETCLLKTG